MSNKFADFPLDKLTNRENYFSRVDADCACLVSIGKRAFTPFGNNMIEQIEPADLEPIHPYILEALRSARAGDLDALAWLESDCIGWALIEPNAALLAVKEVYKPARKPRKSKSRQEAPGRTQRPGTIPRHPARPARASLQAV